MDKNLYKKIIRKLRWLDNFAFDVMNDQKIRIDRNKPHQSIIMYDMTKLHTSFGASTELIKRGLGIDAMIIVRSMLNNLINMSWIANKDNDQRAIKFVDYHAILRKKYLEKVKKHYSQEPRFGGILDQEKQILEYYLKVKNKFPDETKDWSGISIYERAKEVNKNFDYEIVYFLASSIEHSDVYVSKDFIEEVNDNEKTIHFRGGPSKAWFMGSAILSVKYLGEGVELFIKVFELDNKKLLRKLNLFGKRFTQLVSK